MGKGCKVLLIVGIILLAFLVLGLVLSYFYCSEIMTGIMSKSVEALETEVLKDLPEGFDINDVKARFAEFKEVITKQLSEGNMSPKIQSWSRDVQSALEDKKITKEELDNLLQQMKDIVAEQVPSGS